MVHRGPGIHQNVKYWIKPNIENRIKSGEIKALFNSRVIKIEDASVVIETPEGEITLKNDFVFAMTGYRPDLTFLEAHGIRLDPATKRPYTNPETLESDSKGIYLAGVLGGRHAHQRNLHRKRPLPRQNHRRSRISRNVTMNIVYYAWTRAPHI